APHAHRAQLHGSDGAQVCAAENGHARRGKRFPYLAQRQAVFSFDHAIHEADPGVARCERRPQRASRSRREDGDLGWNTTRVQRRTGKDACLLRQYFRHIVTATNEIPSRLDRHQALAAVPSMRGTSARCRPGRVAATAARMPCMSILIFCVTVAREPMSTDMGTCMRSGIVTLIFTAWRRALASRPVSLRRSHAQESEG